MPHSVRNGSLPKAIDHPFTDYHETAEGQPVVYLLGLISIDWNYLEHFFGTLIWHYLGGHRAGPTVTAKMGNQSRADLLLALARKFEKNREFVERVEFAAKVFNRLRENRNVLMHSHSVIFRVDEKLEWRRASSAVHGHVSSLIGLDDLVSIHSSIGHLFMFVLELQLYQFAVRKRRAKPPLPLTFSMPDRLKDLPSEDSPTRKRNSKSNSHRERGPRR